MLTLPILQPDSAAASSAVATHAADAARPTSKSPDLGKYKLAECGLPLTPMLFAAVTLWALISSIFRSPEVAMPGLLSMIAGVPAYFFVRRFVSTGQ